MKRTLGSGTGAILLSALFAMAGSAAVNAAEDLSTGAETWEFTGKGDLSTRQWPVQSAFKMSMEVLRPTADETANPAVDPNASPETRNRSRGNQPPELEFKSDRQFSGNVALKSPTESGGSSFPFSARRSVLFDSQRRAVRVLDVITNSTTADHRVQITFTSTWQPEVAPKMAQHRPFFLNESKTPSGALMAAPRDMKLPLLMLVFGGENKGWKRTVTATQEALSWTYTGRFAARERIVLLHWLSFVDDARSLTLKKARAALIQQGLPKDDSLNPQVLNELINYPMAIEAADSADASLTAGRFHFLNAVAEKLNLEREEEHDQLALRAGPVLNGEFTAADLQLQTPQEEREVPVEDVAAIEGGAGIRRRSRVFFRDGTVTTGTLTWKEAVFKDAVLGTVKLTPESLDTLILRTSEKDQQPYTHTALWVAQDGDVRGLAALPSEACQVRWVGGVMPLAWPEVSSLQQMPPPEVGHEIVFKDGSRIQGWLTPARAASCIAYATDWPSLTKSLSGKTAAQKPSVLHLQLAEGSVIAGAWAEDALTLATGATELQVPVAEIRSLRLVEATSDAPVVLEIETSAGSALTGRPRADALSWRWAGQTLKLPWSQVARIELPQGATASPAATSSPSKP